MDPPEIIVEPTSIPSVPEGEDADFSVIANGLNLTYQWRKDGIDIEDIPDMYSGTNTSQLTVLSVSDDINSSVFTVLIANPTGFVISSNATLRVCKFDKMYNS